MIKATKLHPLHDVQSGLFSTSSGALVNLHKPTADIFTVDDIAQALNNICRFGGQIDEFYSVLQHSLLVFALAPPELAGLALMHDATEAYLGDVIKPLKIMLGKSYEQIESNFQAAIFERFRLDVKDMASIKQYDKQALQIEHDYFFNVRISPLKNIMDMFTPDYERSQKHLYPAPEYNFKEIYKALVYEHFPFIMKAEAQTPQKQTA